MAMPFVSGNLTGDDIVGEITTWLTDMDGQQTGIRFTAVGAVYELSGASYDALKHLIGAVHKLAEWRSVTAFEAVMRLAIEWFQERLASRSTATFTAFLTSSVAAKVGPHLVIVPLQGVRVSVPLSIGPLRLRPITGEDVDTWFGKAGTQAPTFGADSPVIRWKRRIQGLAAVEAHVTAEPLHARAVALAKAEDLAAILRLFSPGISSVTSRCYIAPFGRERLDHEMDIILRAGMVVSLHEGTVLQGPLFLDIGPVPDGHPLRRELALLGELLEDRELTPYEERLLTALRIYSRAALEPALTEKLLHSIVAIETMLVRNPSEPIQETVSTRVAFLVADDIAGRIRAVELVKDAYKKRSAFVHHGSSADDAGNMKEFLAVARALFSALFLNKSRFNTREELIDALERRKLQ